jgi:hypothetical protein
VVAQLERAGLKVEIMRAIDGPALDFDDTALIDPSVA